MLGSGRSRAGALWRPGGIGSVLGEGVVDAYGEVTSLLNPGGASIGETRGSRGRLMARLIAARVAPTRPVGWGRSLGGSRSGPWRTPAPFRAVAVAVSWTRVHGGPNIMATMAGGRSGIDRDARFFLISAVLMTLVLVAGFSVHLALGRSSFAAPISVHAHALLFFGWTGFYLLQNSLVAAGSVALHRRLGWLATAFVPAMVVMGSLVTVGLVQRGAVPFFFQPLYFLIMNPLSILTFAGLTAAAVRLRRQTQWHRRLMLCGMAILTGPGFGRLLPMPFLIPWAGWAVFAATLLFPIAGMVRDLRRSGAIHPAWWWGVGAIVALQLGIEAISGSGFGELFYYSVTEGTAGAAIDPRAYPPLPPL